MKKIELISLCVFVVLLCGCSVDRKNRNAGEDGAVSATADMSEIESSSEEASTEQTDAEEVDYEQRVEQTIAVLEEYFSASEADSPLPEEFREDIESALPDYIRIKDACYGEMGKDENRKQTIAVVLEFIKEYPYKTGDGVMAFGQRVLCIFRKTKEDGYQCTCRNNRLIRDSYAGGLMGDPYAGIRIQDGLLTVSDYGGDRWREGYDCTFGYDMGSLELFRVYRYEYDSISGEGTVEYYNFRTGTAEGYTIEEKNEKIPVDICFVKGFSANELHPIAFEDTEYDGLIWEVEYTCSVERDYLLEAIETQVVLAEDTEIERYEWVDEAKTCFRVRVRYQKAPENSYQHKEDYFFFLKNGAVQQVLYVDYPSKAEIYQDGYPERYPMFACDFDAHMEDVTFDGNGDLIISLGGAGSHGTPISCAYVYEDGVYRYEPTFEDIPTYKADVEQKIIRGYARNGADSYTDSVYKYRNGEFVMTEQKTYWQYYDGNGDVQEIEVD